MDLKYTEVSKQIGLAASHIEFDSQGDSILIDCYHLSCLEKCHKSKLLFSHILHHLLVHLLIDIVNCCSWDFIRGVWIQNVAETWIRVCDINLCSWHWLRGIVILTLATRHGTVFPLSCDNEYRTHATRYTCSVDIVWGSACCSTGTNNCLVFPIFTDWILWLSNLNWHQYRQYIGQWLSKLESWIF